MTVYITDVALSCALGTERHQVWSAARAGDQSGMAASSDFLLEESAVFGQVVSDAPSLLTHSNFERYRCRNNEMAASLVEQMADSIERIKTLYDSHRIGVVMATSTSGIASGEQALRMFCHQEQFPIDYYYETQEIGGLADFIVRYVDISGPSMTVSTACTSGAMALSSAKRWLDLGLVDAVIAGGVDTLCQMTARGFHALGAMSTELTNPFSANRKGLNLGEGGAIFLLTNEPADIRLMGVGASSDAHHISAPDPSGRGAKLAIQRGLEQAGIQASDVDYVNLHGTATEKNDLMESVAVASILGCDVSCSSSKALTGHTLGAAGAIEAGLCWLTLAHRNEKRCIPHRFDGVLDEACSPIRLSDGQLDGPPTMCVSTSFAFGGSNTAVVMGVSA